MPRLKKGMGYLPDIPDSRDLSIDTLGLSVIDLPDRANLASFVGMVLDQGNTSSCVAHAVAAAIGILEKKALLTFNPVSRLFAYYNSRRAHNGHKSDSGTYLRECLKMMSKLGIPDEMFWPFSTSWLKIRRRPPWQSYMMAHPRSGGSYVRIFDYGQDRSKAIMAAIHAGYPVVFGTDVTYSYLESEGPEIVAKPGKGQEIAGGHAQVIVGYEKVDGFIIFDILNSWGRGWRDDGFIRYTQDYIEWERSRDFQIVKGWKRLQQAGGMN